MFGLCTSVRGHSGQTLDLRPQEHRQALKKRDVAATAVVKYVFEAGHKVDLSKASVINYHPHTQTVLESWHITIPLSPSQQREREAPCQDSMQPY